MRDEIRWITGWIGAVLLALVIFSFFTTATVKSFELDRVYIEHGYTRGTLPGADGICWIAPVRDSL